MTHSLTIFDVLNARYVPPDRVATSFIPPPHFERIIRPGNTIVVGARGTGKTTLLKMLRLPALQAWDDFRKYTYLENLHFVSALISNDRNWSSRINDFASQFESIELQRYVRLALVSTQALRAIITAASEVFNGDLSDVPIVGTMKIEPIRSEVVFAQTLSSRILQTQAVVTANDLHQKLGVRIDKLISDANAMRHIGLSETEVAAANRWIFDDFLAPLKAAVDTFADVTQSVEHRWCLCFDELELAHKDVRDLLFGYLRGADPNFYFKLATVPFTEDIETFSDRSAPTPQHDFSVVELWEGHRDAGSEFLMKLANSTVSGRGLVDESLESIAGVSFEGRASAPRGALAEYSNASKFYEDFLILAGEDDTFRQFLSDRNITVEDFLRMNEDRRAALFRKVQKIVLVRSAFFPRNKGRNVSGRNTKRRPNYRGFAYAGAQNIIQMCDNNPRFLIAALDPIITEYKRTGRVVGAEAQLQAIREVSKQVGAVLRAEAIYPPQGQLTSVFSLSNRVGEFFEEEVHGGPFNPDPVLSFTIDETSSASVAAAVAFAVREGAMILDAEYSGGYLRTGIMNKRIRLSYLLAPDYRLPLMVGRQRNLEGILKAKGRRQDRTRSHHPDLFRGGKDE